MANYDLSYHKKLELNLIGILTLETIHNPEKMLLFLNSKTKSNIQKKVKAKIVDLNPTNHHIVNNDLVSAVVILYKMTIALSYLIENIEKEIEVSKKYF